MENKLEHLKEYLKGLGSVAVAQVEWIPHSY